MNGIDGIHGTKVLVRRSWPRQADCHVRNRRTPFLYKKRIGRRVLTGDLRHRRLRSQIANQNRSASSRDGGETENDVFHVPRIRRSLAVCLSG